MGNKQNSTTLEFLYHQHINASDRWHVKITFEESIQFCEYVTIYENVKFFQQIDFGSTCLPINTNFCFLIHDRITRTFIFLNSILQIQFKIYIKKQACPHECNVDSHHIWKSFDNETIKIKKMFRNHIEMRNAYTLLQTNFNKIGISKLRIFLSKKLISNDVLDIVQMYYNSQ